MPTPPRTHWFRRAGKLGMHLANLGQRGMDAWAARLLAPHGVLCCDTTASAARVDAAGRGNAIRTAPLRLTIVIVSYQQPEALLALLASLGAQSLQNFALHVLHDGPHPPTRAAVAGFAAAWPQLPLRYEETAQRHNDWGHSLRELGLRQAQGEFLLVTNGDNLLAPRLVEHAFAAIDDQSLDLVLWDLVHSHPRPGGLPLPSGAPFRSHPFRYRSDVGALLVRTARAQQVGFRDRGHDADATYLEDLLYLSQPRPLRLGVIRRTLLVHN